MSLFDFLRPAWEHSNPDIRLKAVRGFDPSLQQNLLLGAARKDPDPRVRKAALLKIDELELLAPLEEGESDGELKKLLKQKIDAGALQLLKQTLQPEAIDRWFPRLKDQSAWETLLHTAQIPELRLLCAEKVNRPQPLAHTARQDSDEQVALAAAEKIDDPELLREIARSARHDSVREEAERRLSVREQAEAEEREEGLRHLRVEALLTTLRRFSEERQILSLETEAKELIAEWDSLREIASPEQQNEFGTLRETVEERIAAARAAHDAAEKLRVEEESRFQKAEALVGEMKELFRSSENRAELLERFWTFTAEWKDAAQHLSQKSRAFLEPELAALTQRATQIADSEQSLAEQAKRAAAEKFRAEKERIREEARVKTDAARALFNEKLEQLEVVIEKVRNLNPEEEFEAAVEKLKHYRGEWNEIVGEEREKFGKAWKRFRQAASSFSHLEDWERWHNQREREQLIEEAEALDSEEDEPTILREVKRLREGWRKAGGVAREQHEELKEKFQTAIDKALARCESYLAEREKERENNLLLKQELIKELQEYVDTHPDPDNTATQGMKNLQEKWRLIGPVPQEQNDLLWEEYRAVSDLFFSRRRDRMKVEKKERSANLDEKRKLCEEAEALVDSTDWNGTAAALKQLQERWKATGPVSRQQSETVWKRFRTACDTFFDRRKAHFEQQDSGKRENLAGKEALIAELEQLDRSGEVEAIEAELKRIASAWEAIGPVPPKEVEKVMARYCAAADGIVDALMERDPKYRSSKETVLKAKRVIAEQAKNLIHSSDWKGTADQLKVLRNEWNLIGRAGSAEAPLWEEFREACDRFYERRKDQFDIMEQSRLNNLDQKMILVEQAERLALRPDEEARREVRMLRRQWREIGQVPRRDADRIWKRFNTACDAVFAED